MGSAANRDDSVTLDRTPRQDVRTSDLDFASFYQSAYTALVGFGNRLRPGHGEDLAQSACERVWAGRHRYGATDLRPVAFRAVANLVLDECRRERIVRQEPTDFSGAAVETRLPTPQHRLDLARPAVRRFITGRPDMNERRVLTLCWVGEMTEAEVVRATGISRRTVRTMLGRARAAMARELLTAPRTARGRSAE